LVARFTAELTALGGVVHHTSSDASSVARIIAGLPDVGRPARALMWDDRWLPVDGLGAALEAEGFQIDQQGPDDLASPDRRAVLATASVGITGVEASLRCCRRCMWRWRGVPALYVPCRIC
jgi:hypothetical protein